MLSWKWSDALELGDGPFVSDITRIHGGFGLNQDDVHFLVRYRTMLDFPWGL